MIKITAGKVRKIPGAGLVLALLLTGCTDQRTPLEPLASSIGTPAFDLFYTDATFVSTPPDPALVGETYLVAAEPAAEVVLHSETPAVCAFLDGESVSSPATVAFLASGTCTLVARCDFCVLGIPAYQTFEVVQPRIRGGHGTSRRPPGVPYGRGGVSRLRASQPQ